MEVKNGIIMENKKGLTLIETMVALTIGGAAIATTTELVMDQQVIATEDRLGEEINSVVNGIDKRLKNDSFDLTMWSNFASVNYTYNNTSQVSDFLNRALVAVNAPNCGQINGWIPQKEDPVDEAYKDEYQLIQCNLWSKNLPFKLNAKSVLRNNGSLIDSFEMDFFFAEEQDFEDHYLNLKNIARKSERMEKEYLSGVTTYNFVNINTGTDLDSTSCINAKENCGLRVTFTGSDTEQDYLNVNGNNNMIGSKVKFQQDITSTALNNCHRYTDASGVWERVDGVFCGVGLGFTDPANPASGTLNYVELNTGSVSTERIFLDKACNFTKSDGTSLNVPCGAYKETRNVAGVMTDFVVATYDEVYTTDLLTNVVQAKKVFADEAYIKTDLDVDGETTLSGALTVSGLATFNDELRVAGNASSTNLIVETSADLKDTQIDGDLSVFGESRFNGDLSVFGNIDVTGLLSTDRIKLKKSINNTQIGGSCASEGNGTLSYYSAGVDSDLAVCANGYWKLVNMQKDKIVAFNGSCPSGFRKFSEADGRVLIGSGSLYDSASGTTMNYSTGQVGGSAFHVLTESEMPAHNHNVQDAYWSEHWGDYGPKNQRGASGGQDSDNNLYTRNTTTAVSGGSQAHENRMPYYVVNWCIYEG